MCESLATSTPRKVAGQRQAGSSSDSTIRPGRENGDTDEDDVPPEFRLMSPKTPQTPPGWIEHKSKPIDIQVKGKMNDRRPGTDLWPPSFPTLDRRVF